MANIEEINIGSLPNDGTGDTIRAAFSKVNSNDEALNKQVESLQENQVDGILRFDTKALLDLETGSETTAYKVTDDPTEALNGDYRYNGSIFEKTDLQTLSNFDTTDTITEDSEEVLTSGGAYDEQQRVNSAISKPNEAIKAINSSVFGYSIFKVASEDDLITGKYTGADGNDVVVGTNLIGTTDFIDITSYNSVYYTGAIGLDVPYVIFFDASDNVISAISSATEEIHINIQATKPIGATKAKFNGRLFGINDEYIGFEIHRVNSSVYNDSIVKKILDVDSNIDTAVNKPNEINKKLQALIFGYSIFQLADEIDLTSSQYIGTDGNVITGASEFLGATDFIDISSLTDVYYTGAINLNVPYAVFYDASNAFVSYVSSATEQVFLNEKIPKPAGATKVKFNARLYGYTPATSYIGFQANKLNANNYAMSLVKQIEDAGGLAYITEEDGGTIIENAVNASWSGWSETRLQYGLNPAINPVPTINEGQAINKGTMIVGGTETNKMRWGYHCYEGYMADNLSRVTLLVNKHIIFTRPVTSLYMFLADYQNPGYIPHGQLSYGYTQLGCDIFAHGDYVGRDKSYLYNIQFLRNILQVNSINPSTDLLTNVTDTDDADETYEPENDALNHLKAMRYLALKNAEDGAIWYDNQRHQLVLRKNGAWHDVDTTPITAGTYPDFE